jgi:GGDEF domain-containing protein
LNEFNLAELDNLEKRERHLSVLAAVIVLVMAGGVALLMYPLVFVHPAPGEVWPLRFAFIGFCALSVLFVAYLLDRHRMVRKLKQHLVIELKRNLELRYQASADLLHSLPDMNHFQDRLLMEFRRASNGQQPLTLLVAQIKLPAQPADKNSETAALGEAARAISHHLRENDSMYVFGKGLFGLVLSETNTATANRIKSLIEETLRSAGAAHQFSIETHLWNYPDHVKSAHELDDHVASLLPESEAVGKV